MAGTLYLVATPIGNLEDITFRAINVLKQVDLIAAEDTRHSRILMDAYEITTPMTSYHEHNKYEKADVLIERLLAGESIAVVTDAGTPGISDPGEVLAEKAIEAGIKVTSIPGACALITAITLSAMPARRFAFEGFLPGEPHEHKQALAGLKDETRTIIMYEAPHRLKKTLSELEKTLGGGRRIAVCRELTKIHEEALKMTIAEAGEYYDREDPRGEYVLVIDGKSADEVNEERAAVWADMTLTEHLAYYMDRGVDKKEAMKKMAADRNCSRRDIYNMLLKEDGQE